MLLLSACQVAFAQPAKVRGWIFLDRNEDYLRSALPKAKEMGINHVEFSHDIVMNAEQIIGEPDRAALLRRMTRLYKANGIETFVWTHEFEGVPGTFIKNDRIDTNNPELWEWLAAKYRRVFETLPDLDGLVLTMSETWRTPLRDQYFTEGLNLSQRITKIVTAIHDAIAPMGKRLWVRTWGNLGAEGLKTTLPKIAEGIKNCPPDVAVHNKHTAGDFYFLTRSPLIGCFDGRDEIIEFDPAGEFHGQAVVPWCAPEYYKSDWDYCLSKGADGAVARVDRMANNALGTPNEVTIYALSRYLMDPSATPDECWKEWTVKRFGPEAATVAESALRKTDEIITSTFYTLRCYFMQDHSNVPDYDYPARHLRGSSAKGIDDALATNEPKLLDPTPEALAEVLAEKDRAISLCRQAIAELEAGRAGFRPEDYIWLRRYFDRELLLAKVYRQLHEVYFRAELAKKGLGTREDFEESVKPLLGYAYYIERRFGPEVRPVCTFKPRGLIVKRIREFVEQARARVGS
jgi:hypothetical protein